MASAAWAHRWVLPYLDPWGEVLFPGIVATVLGHCSDWRGSRACAGPPGHRRRDHLWFYAQSSA